MGHPPQAYAFNEHSLSCCEDQASLLDALAVIDRARAWRLHEAGPLVTRIKGDEQLPDATRGKLRDKILLLLEAGNRESVASRKTPAHLSWNHYEAKGLSKADDLGGWAVSWPSNCGQFTELYVSAQLVSDDSTRVVRHVASIDHLLAHWQRCSKAAKKTAGRPASVQRVDNALNASSGEVPQVHFKDGSALNIDGVWKHGDRALNASERAWLSTVGWVLPEP